MLPAISELAAQGDWAGFRSTVERALQVLIALTVPIAAVMSAGLAPLVRGVFGFDQATSTLITWTSRAYLLTLTGYTVQEIAVRAFYARKEPMVPLYAVALRISIFLGIGYIGITFFSNIGAPVIAFAEIAVLIEAIFLLVLLSNRLHEPIHVGSALVKGFLAAFIGGIIAYAVAVYLPGGAIVTALAGMIVGGVIALAIVWSEAKQLLHL
jgi:putative peptidoglycan lipid II flippase